MPAPSERPPMTVREQEAFVDGVGFALLWLNVPKPRRDEVLNEAKRTAAQWGAVDA